MYRKIFLLCILLGFSFGLGVLFMQNIEHPRGELFSAISRAVHLHGDLSFDERKKAYEKIGQIGSEMCAHIFPAPIDMEDCINSLEHGIAHSFDPHSVYRNAVESNERRLNESGVLEGIGVSIHLIPETKHYAVKEILHGGVAEAYGIRSNDEFKSINNVPIKRFRNVYEVARAIRGKPGTRVTLEMKHAGDKQAFVVSVERRSIPRPQIEGVILSYSGKSYGFIRAHHFNKNFANKMNGEVSRLMHSSPQISGLIISMEGNPGGYAHEVNSSLDLFMDAESFVLERSRLGIEKAMSNPFVHTQGDITNGLPILVVVDESSASASEIFAGAMQLNGRALVYGTKTFGKGTVQDIITFSDGSEISVTIAEYLIGTIEDWIPVQCVGITPDILRAGGILEQEKRFECMSERSLASAGPMPSPPKHRPFMELHPDQYRVGLNMIDAYETFRLIEEKKKPAH